MESGDKGSEVLAAGGEPLTLRVKREVLRRSGDSMVFTSIGNQQ